MFDKRLLMVTGKGGVGKTTISGALALAAARLGKKVLLVDVGGGGLAARLGVPDLTHEPAEIRPLVWAVRVDPRRALDEYVHTFVKSRFIADRITGSKLFDYLAAGTPGLREIITLGKVWLWERQPATGAGHSLYDLLIVDAPATGHGLSFLQAPQMLIDMIGVGPIRAQTEEVLRLLRDRRRTLLHLVTVPEELPVQETLQLYRAAVDGLRMPVGPVFLNGLFPRIFSPREATEVKRRLRSTRRGGEDGYWPPVLRAARVAVGRRAQQEFYAQRLREKVPLPFIEIPYLFDDADGPAGLEAIARRLLGDVPA